MTASTIRSSVVGLLLIGSGGLGLAAGYLLARELPDRERSTAQHAEGEPGGAGQRTSSGIRVAPRRSAPDELMEELGALGYAESYETISEVPGVSSYDPERAYPGSNLIVSAHAPVAILADMQGEALHEWRFEYGDIPGAKSDVRGTFRRAHVLDDGGLLAVFDYHALIRLDRDSNLLWSLVGGFHHDLEVVADGSIFVLDQESRIVPRFNEERPTFENYITQVSADGEVLERWSILEAFERSRYAPFLRKAAAGGDNFHTNTLEVFDGSRAHLSPLFAEGHALVSVWGLDVIAIIDLERNEVLWAMSGMWHRQHQPVLLEDGNILLFDNMGADPWSKVIEFEPFTRNVVWSFEGDAENDFYSQLLGSCQRLPNGNTLITESFRATAFEVDRAGETVWRYVSPYRFDRETDDLPVLMEVVRLPPASELGWLE